MASYPGVPLTIGIAGGTPIVILGDPVYRGAFLLNSGTAFNAFVNSNARASDIDFMPSLANVAQFNTPAPAVSIGRKFVNVNNTQVSNPLVPDPTALTPPVLNVVYGNETTQTISTLLTDLQASQTTIKASGITTVYYSPLGAALQNGTLDPNFNALCSTADGLIFQTQRQGQWTLSLAAFITAITPTVNAIKAATMKPLILKITTYDPNNPSTLATFSAMVQIINGLGAAFQPAGIHIDWPAAANATASQTLYQSLITNYRP